MYEIRINGNEDSYVCGCLSGAMTCALLSYRNGNSADVINLTTGEVVMIVSKRKMYVAECVKMVM